MAISQIPNRAYYYELTSTPTQIGVITKSTGDTIVELDHARLKLLKYGTMGGSETLQLKLFTDSSLTAEFAASNTINVSDITSVDYWLGMVRFDFTTAIKLSSTPYYAAVVTTNYTQSGSRALMFSFDHPEFIQRPAGSSSFGVGCLIELYGRS